MPNRITFAVIYRSGGTEDCRWTRVAERYDSRESAQVMAASIEKAGRKALIFTTASLDTIGLPIGWEPGFDKEGEWEITTGPFDTHAKKVA